MEHFDNTVISSEEFTIKTLGMEFLSIKDDNNNQTKHFDITVISSEEFTIKALGMEFLFIKGDNNNLIIFKDKEREIDGKVMMMEPCEDISHIHYKGTRIYFNNYVIADMKLSKDKLLEPVKDLFSQILWIFNDQF
ncbi:unnamed protein product [Rhizophagus irregularis]|uniref:Uncharacterized protein n=1 Tax=Rhizophagus irregularis TaxID=588596 RepID=A0A2N1MQD6_9GLOM|nr:hypothetical protein RhiirC2_788335 [Rhizophagus irregularis]CAB4396610.1 unnamed protein product [Rhizophagus irregularis]CAB4473521.1 unnamed protein product [Rhizophagus irregularis]CAB5384696.1 unnamed protein product [Rhizophagus irregularis]CAB5388172.1 unnamed protein product [Rhizophagus irregularis]